MPGGSAGWIFLGFIEIRGDLVRFQQHKFALPVYDMLPPGGLCERGRGEAGEVPAVEDDGITAVGVEIETLQGGK